MTNLPASSIGAFTVNAGTLVFNDNHTRAFSSGGFSGAGTVEFQSGTIDVTSSYALSAGGTTKISGAVVDLSSGSVTNIGGNLVISGGSLLLGANQSVGTFTWSGGTLSGAGQTQVNNLLSMSGSTMSLSGRTLLLANSGTATLAGAGALSGSGTLNIAGTLSRIRQREYECDRDYPDRDRYGAVLFGHNEFLRDLQSKWNHDHRRWSFESLIILHFHQPGTNRQFIFHRVPEPGDQ